MKNKRKRKGPFLAPYHKFPAMYLQEMDIAQKSYSIKLHQLPMYQMPAHGRLNLQ